MPSLFKTAANNVTLTFKGVKNGKQSEFLKGFEEMDEDNIA
jgi:hypothetical protein